MLHWLGTAFDPSLEGYLGSTDWREASTVLLEIIEENVDRVAGVEDEPAGCRIRGVGARPASRGRAHVHRRRLQLRRAHRRRRRSRGHAARPRSGEPRQHSDALLGAFAAITPVASAAIQALDAGDPARYLEILGPTEELSRQVFAAPTFYYKTGVAFLSWLNGHQSAFQMVGGLHSARSLPHLSRIVELANGSLALEQPELAAERWHGMLRLNGVDA